jgi:phospholipase C
MLGTMTRRALRDLRKLFTRRRALQGLGATVGAGIVGCGDDGEANGDGTTDGGEDTSSGSTSTGGSTSTDSGVDVSSSSGGSSESSTGDAPPMSDCEATTELTPEELLAPIEHIIVVMMENRSFDHVFGARALRGHTVDGLTGRETNPGVDGEPVAVHPTDDFAIQFDPPHQWETSHAQWNDGENDGFVTEAAAHGALDPSVVMSYFDGVDMPVSWALADNYSLCDRWFASVMGPTWPNRFYLHLASAYGNTGNDPIEVPVVSIFDRLTEQGITNTYYSSNLPFVATYGKDDGIDAISNFFEAAAAGTLPQFSIVDPIFTALLTIGNDDHPPADVRMGQAFLATIHDALAQSPLWDRCLLVITYDEHGGFYDHVPPPTTTDELPEFEQLGFRVPALVIGPHVRRGCVTSTQFDHVSIIATATRRWGLEPINARVEETNDLSACIDPSFIDDPQPPAALPKMLVKRPQLSWPGANFHGQAELAALADRGGVKPEHDRRAQVEETMATLLAWGERLGTLEVVD